MALGPSFRAGNNRHRSANPDRNTLPDPSCLTRWRNSGRGLKYPPRPRTPAQCSISPNPPWPGIAVRRTASLPLAYARHPRLPARLGPRREMPGTGPGMTKNEPFSGHRNGVRIQAAVAAGTSGVLLGLEDLAALVHAGLEIEVVRTAQFAGILVLVIRRLLQGIGRTAHATPRRRCFSSGNGHFAIL